MAIAPSRPSLLQLLAVLVAVAFGAGACGDDGGDTALPATTTAAADDAGDADDGDMGDGDMGDGSPYCARSIAFNEGASDPPFDDPEGVQAYYEGILDQLAEMRSVAPDELQASLDVLATNFAAVTGILENAEWDFEVAGPDLDAYTGDPEVDAQMDGAFEILDAYDATVCGIDF